MHVINHLDLFTNCHHCHQHRNLAVLLVDDLRDVKEESGLSGGDLRKYLK